MNPNSPNEYNPADDGNQGVVQLLAQSEEANASIPQADYMNPAKAQGSLSEKTQVNNSDVDANGVNDDLLEEENVEDGDADETENE